MPVLFVILMFVAFLAADFVVREVTRRVQEGRRRHQREKVLEVAVRTDAADEARSLKRTEVPEPRARILAVDDESVVLDSFRKILVLDGFNVDTVENGPEALGLIQRRDYDFVFTDLKMPDMDGVEVVKAVKHLRPDIDVVVITGYATIETAVETMRHGACEYVQKPFTATELSEFVEKLLIKREARLEAQSRPVVRIVAPYVADAAGTHEYCIPGGVFVSPGHAWARIEPGGQVRIGADDFIRKALGSADEVIVPENGRVVKKGEELFSIRRGSEKVRVLSPLGGKVVDVNARLKKEAALLMASPHEDGWVCQIEPGELASELPSLLIGMPVVAWYQDEVTRWHKVQAEPRHGSAGELAALEEQFLRLTEFAKA